MESVFFDNLRATHRGLCRSQCPLQKEAEDTLPLPSTAEGTPSLQRTRPASRPDLEGREDAAKHQRAAFLLGFTGDRDVFVRVTCPGTRGLLNESCMNRLVNVLWQHVRLLSLSIRSGGAHTLFMQHHRVLGGHFWLVCLAVTLSALLPRSTLDPQCLATTPRPSRRWSITAN